MLNSDRLSILAAAALFVHTPMALPAEAQVKCEMTFSMKGWSAFYKTASGTGTVKCSNGQSSTVKLRATGGGLTVGKSSIEDGRGAVSAVHDLEEILGSYASA